MSPCQECISPTAVNREAIAEKANVLELGPCKQSELKKQKLKYRLPLVTSLSLGIDLRTAERFLVDEGYVAK
jgi:hypothetical protein